jgi:hypothetical protein
MSVRDPYLINVDLDVHLRDARHAHRLYTEHSFALAPKTKFLYHVVFQPVEKNSAISNSVKFSKEIGVLAKTVDLPQYRASVDNKQQYNRKKNIQTRIDYQDVTIRFHDDNNGLTRAMLEEYYRYYFRDGNNNPATGSFNARDKYSTVVPRYGLDNGTRDPFFNYIKIYQLARRNWFSYTLINPLITQWGHDTLDNSDGAGMMENSIVIAYEGVLYDHGKIDGSEPAGFTDEETRYDNVPSPLGYWDKSLSGFYTAEPTLLNPTPNTPLGLLARMSNSGSRASGSNIQNTGPRLPGALPQYLIPTQDTQAGRSASTISTFNGRVSNSDALISGLNSNPSANKSFLARALNSGTVNGVNYSTFTGLNAGAKAAIEADLQNAIRTGDRKLSNFAQEAINSTRG